MKNTPLAALAVLVVALCGCFFVACAPGCSSADLQPENIVVSPDGWQSIVTVLENAQESGADVAEALDVLERRYERLPAPEWQPVLDALQEVQRQHAAGERVLGDDELFLVARREEMLRDFIHTKVGG